MGVPKARIRTLVEAPPDPRGGHVLYWMTAARRPAWSFALDRAIELAKELSKPLLVVEPLACTERYACARRHRFAMAGMRDNASAFERAGVRYLPWVETQPKQLEGAWRELAARSCAVVTDDHPSWPVAWSASKRLERVDGNGLYPMRATKRVFSTAASFRRHLQRELRLQLRDLPRVNPLARLELPHYRGRLPRAPEFTLDALPIDHRVGRSPLEGGRRSALAQQEAFLETRLPRYASSHNHPDDDASSGLSPYLHFGHLSAHEVFHALAAREDWTPENLGKATGHRAGWWGLSESAEAFLDELVTWRELSFNFSALRDDAMDLASLPPWALKTLAEHARDPREALYPLGALEAAETSDPLWNAAQRQLLREGRIHNALRMLWGKRVLAWTRSPQQAAEWLVHLNDRWALDGCDPCSYGGIFWVFGRYDRPWGPERAIYGKVRYMSSRNTARKLRLRRYLEEFGTLAEARVDS